MLPVIDVSGLASADLRTLSRIGFQIGQACRDVGFFYVVNHGLPAEDRDAVFEASHRFFALHEGEKSALSIARERQNRGYVALRTEALDPGRNVDNKEAFNIGLELDPADPEIAAGVISRASNRWPDLPGFRTTMLAYFDRLHRLGRDLHKAIALDLGVDALHFEPMFDRPMATLRLLHYPPTGGSPHADFGAGAHTDYGNLTILLTDGVGGLEVQTRDGQWLSAPTVPGAFICNIGDCLMRWTNDIYVSTPHRVVSPPGIDRYSIAFFLDPNPDACVDVLPTCHGPHREKRYPPILASDYLAARLAQTYGFETI